MTKLTKLVASVACACGLALSASAPVAAYDGQGRGQITLIEADGGARFHLSADTEGCPAGTWLTMTTNTASPEKIKNAQSIILAAFLAGREVRVYTRSDSCEVEFIHLL